MVKVAFYGGVNEIGGNKILVQDKKTKVLFDFGQSFNFGAEYFTGWLSPRAINGLGDHFEFGLLPKIRELYAKEKLVFTDIPYSEPEIDAIFLSHAHFDHVTHICFTDPQIPVYLGVGAKLFLESMEETSSFCDYGNHDYRTFRTGKKIKVGDIEVEPIHMDHSIPAAYGFLIRTSEGTVAYTGDLRMHGARKDLTDDFVQRAKESKPTALVCEGTRMTLKEKRKNYSEAQVEHLSKGTAPEKLDETTIESVMERQFPQVSADTVLEAVAVMLDYSSAVLVTTDGQVSGIITPADFLKLSKLKARKRKGPV